jgi:hypothetical protein
MPATADARAMPSIAAYWVKNNILAAVISAAVSLCVYGVRQATGAADADAAPGAVAFLYATAAILWAFSGSADGLLTGAVLQRAIPLLPVRLWIGLHASMAVVVGAMAELGVMRASGDTKGPDDVSMGEALVAGFVVGAIIGAVVGGLQALVLRKAALGTGAWMAWSTVAYAMALSLIAAGASLWDAGGGFAGELANQAVAFLAAVTISLVMLQALRRLRNPLRSTAAGYFS